MFIFFVIDYVTIVCLIDWAITLLFILLDSFIDIPTDLSNDLFVSELYFIKGLQRRVGIGISEVTVFKIEFRFIVFMLCY